MEKKRRVRKQSVGSPKEREGVIERRETKRIGGFKG